MKTILKENNITLSKVFDNILQTITKYVNDL